MFAEQYFTMPKKKPGQLSLFPETQYHYHVLLSPPETIMKDVAAMMQAFGTMVNIAPYNFTPAHITLHEFEAPESYNYKDLLRSAMSRQKPFVVKIDGQHKWGTTFALKIENPDPITNIAAIAKDPSKEPVKRVRQTSIIDKPVRKPKSEKTPHITIARHLPEDYKEKIADFTLFDYRNEWLCESVIILRKKIGDVKSQKIEIKLKG